MSNLLFPPSELDGLSATITAKAAQHFVAYLSALQQKHGVSSRSSEELHSDKPIPVTDTWQSIGFADLHQQATTEQALLLIYLHSPLHAYAEQFCKKVLLHPAFSSLLNDPHVLSLGVSVHTALGSHLQSLLGATSLPCLAVLQPKEQTGSSATANNGPLQLLFRAQGPTLWNLLEQQQPNNSSNSIWNPETALLPLLRTTLQHHSMTIAERTARRLQREEEVALRQAQDDEYQQTLLADQARERERLAHEERERDAAREAARKEEDMQNALEERKALAMSLVRPEPDKGGANIRFTFSTGLKLMRRFHGDDTVGTLRAFVWLQGQDDGNKVPKMERIGLSTSFPRVTYEEGKDDEKTLQEAGLVPQAVLMVQDLDA